PFRADLYFEGVTTGRYRDVAAGGGYAPGKGKGGGCKAAGDGDVRMVGTIDHLHYAISPRGGGHVYPARAGGAIAVRCLVKAHAPGIGIDAHGHTDVANRPLRLGLEDQA